MLSAIALKPSFLDAAMCSVWPSLRTVSSFSRKSLPLHVALLIWEALQHIGDSSPGPPSLYKRRVSPRPVGVNRDTCTAVCHACVSCSLARRVRHSCHHGQFEGHMYIYI